MKNIILLVLFISFQAGAQSKLGKLQTTVKEFHQALVKNDRYYVRDHVSSSLSYGHSNGWIENSTDFGTNLESGYIKYNGFREDSMNIIMLKHVAHVRFVGDLNVTLNGKTADYHLRVLEVWVRESKNWKLFARQAVK